MIKAYSYTRFSTPEQLKGDSYRRQTEAASIYAAQHGMLLDTELSFEDLGVSAFRGKNAETGALADFRDAVRSGLVEPGSVLLVESLDRISRQSARKAIRVLEDIVEDGVTVITLSDGRAYDKESLDKDPMSFLIALLIFIRANEESERKASRLKAAWSGKRSKAAHTPLTSIVPAWMHKVGERIELIPERAEVVRRIIDMTLAGTGQHKIAETLNREGVPVFGDGQQWHRSYVSKILENPALIGTLIPHETTFANGKKERKPLDPIHGYFPALVSEEEWSQLSTMAQGRKPKVKTGAKLQNILSGLGKCAHCGASMVRVPKGARSRPKLVCSRAKTGGGCEYHSANMSDIEWSVRGGLRELAMTYPTLDVDVDQKAAEVRAIEDELGILIDELIQHGRSPVLTTARMDAEARLEKAQEQLREAIAQSNVRQKAKPEALLAMEDAPLEEVNSTLRALYREVLVNIAEGGAFSLGWVPAGSP